MKRGFVTFALGVMTGAILFGGGTAAQAGLVAEPCPDRIYVDGRQTAMRAYRIAGSNYVKLRDIGQAVDFNVYWEDGVRVDSFSPYTGEAPEIGEIAVPLAAGPAEAADTVRREMVARANAVRKSHGMKALRTDEKAMEAAQVRAEEMAAATVYSHIRPDGRKRSTVTDCPYTTENIHCISIWRLEQLGQSAAETAVEEWAASEEHLKGILDETRGSIGAGAAMGVSPTSGLPCWYCVLWFVREGCAIQWVDGPVGRT